MTVLKSWAAGMDGHYPHSAFSLSGTARRPACCRIDPPLRQTETAKELVQECVTENLPPTQTVDTYR
jgi:hypothetical protein